MLATPLLEAIEAHTMDGLRQHPGVKTLGQYPDLIHTWAKAIADAGMENTPAVRDAQLGRLFLQLAALLLRGITELDLPLTEPKPLS